VRRTGTPPVSVTYASFAVIEIMISRWGIHIPCKSSIPWVLWRRRSTRQTRTCNVSPSQFRGRSHERCSMASQQPSIAFRTVIRPALTESCRLEASYSRAVIGCQLEAPECSTNYLSPCDLTSWHNGGVQVHSAVWRCRIRTAAISKPAQGRWKRIEAF
jgi:hypothetical protein